MENKVLELIAKDRLHIPMSSLDQKLKRAKTTSAKGIAGQLGDAVYTGERVFAYVESEDKERARGTKEAIAEFSKEFPKYGTILAGKIAEKRVRSEEHLYFGINPGCKLTADDYIGVMTSLGLTEPTARSLYPDLMDISRKLQRAKSESRSIIVGKYASPDD
jgi:hypothetical protein